MNQSAAVAANRAEDEMVQTIRGIEKARASETSLLLALRQSQQAWLAFRDAELAALFPEEDKQLAYGSMYNLCRANQRQRLAEERTRELRLWLDGDPGASGCSGAVAVAPGDR